MWRCSRRTWSARRARSSASETPLWRQVRGWLLDTLTRVGAPHHLGRDLFEVFRGAGLPDPRLTLETFAGGGAQAPVWAWTNVVGAMIPLMERLGVVTRDEAGVETLDERLLAETDAEDGIVLGPLMMGSWLTVPRALDGAGRRCGTA